MKRVKQFLDNNIVLIAFLSIVLLGAVFIVWKFTLQAAVDMVVPINRTEVLDNEFESSVESDSDNNRFEYTDSGVIYHPLTGSSVGPFQYVYEDEFFFSWETIARYVDENGKYGYLNRDGSLLTEPIFIDAAEFEDGTARVREKKGTIYYIASQGKRITKDYLDGSATFEMQGLYCRVQTEDGKWGIINRQDELIFTGADSIEELPMVTTFGSAIVGGSAVLFELNPFEGDTEFEIIACFDSYKKISYVYSGEFAFVWDANNRMGVVDYHGEIILPAIYKSVDYKYIGDDYSMENIVFLARDENEDVHVIYARGGYAI